LDLAGHRTADLCGWCTLSPSEKKPPTVAEQGWEAEEKEEEEERPARGKRRRKGARALSE
jgi:hypothetical protein